MSEPKITIKDLPQDVLDEVWAFADPYFEQAIDKSIAGCKENGTSLSSENGDLHPHVVFAMMVMKCCFVRLAGEVLIQDRANRKAIDGLRKSLEAERVRA
jgi:hypothetical protein